MLSTEISSHSAKPSLKDNKDKVYMTKPIDNIEIIFWNDKIYIPENLCLKIPFNQQFYSKILITLITYLFLKI